MLVILDILKYTIPAIVVLVACYFMVKAFLLQEEKKVVLQLKIDAQKISLPVRMQAYERLVLLLERLQPAGLILRNSAPGMNAAALQGILLQAIRDEFDHNLSQQLYVSSEVWEMVKSSREESMRMINAAASSLPIDAQAAELAQKILIHDMEITGGINDKAIEALKQEARNSFF
jgi:hypothetical protein